MSELNLKMLTEMKHYLDDDLPVEQVRELYDKYPQSCTFEEDLGYYLDCGYVCNTPQAFAMGEPTFSTTENNIDYDAWFIHTAAGDLKTILTFLPYKLPYVIFARRGKKPKLYELDKVLRLCKSMTKSKECICGLATEHII